MSRRPIDGCLENGHNGASENKRPRMELPFNGGQPASTSTVTSPNGVLVHRNGFHSHQPPAEFSSKCPICLWPLFSPRCYHSPSIAQNGSVVLGSFASNGSNGHHAPTPPTSAWGSTAHTITFQTWSHRNVSTSYTQQDNTQTKPLFRTGTSWLLVRDNEQKVWYCVKCKRPSIPCSGVQFRIIRNFFCLWFAKKQAQPIDVKQYLKWSN